MTMSLSIYLPPKSLPTPRQERGYGKNKTGTCQSLHFHFLLYCFLRRYSVQYILS